MQVKIYKSITDVNQPEWDAIVGKNKVFCTHGFTSAVEKSGIMRVDATIRLYMITIKLLRIAQPVTLFS